MSVRPAPRVTAVDVAILADFRTGGEPAWRLVQEIRFQAAAGYRTALVHLPAPGSVPGTASGVEGRAVHPAIDACVREGLAVPVPARDCWLQADLLQVATPHCLGDLPDAVPHIDAARCLIVADGMPAAGVDGRADGGAVAAIDRTCRALFGARARWTATTEAVRLRLADVVACEPAAREPVVAAPARTARPARRRPVVGRTVVGDATRWPAAADLREVYPSNGQWTVRILGRPEARSTGMLVPPASWQLFPEEASIERFVAGLDFFAYYTAEIPDQPPMTAIALALCAGVPVLLPPELEPVIGPGPIYLPAADAGRTIQRLHREPDAYDAAAQAARAAGAARFGAEGRTCRPGAPRRDGAAGAAGSVVPVRAAGPEGGRRVLFVSSNGVGLGHLTRLLAIARRLPPGIEPVFATMSQALAVVEAFGFPVEHITSHLYTGVDFRQWNGWLRRQMDEMIDFHDAAAVVLDSTNPYDGLIQAVLPRDRCRLIWIRRGLWRPTAINRRFLGHAPFFDLVVEPEDIAAAADEDDLVAADRDAVLPVPPIRLLDPDELLPREAAAAALGLDPGRPAVLVQLGSGANRDVFRLTDRVVAALRRRPGLQVAVVEWLIANASPPLWDGVVNVRGYPVSRYYRAFDFTVSAAGYNSFTEALSFGLPAIFIANDHMSMDDQAARSRFAHAAGAGFHLPERDLGGLDAMIEAMLDPDRRDLFRFNASRLWHENGAMAAARAVAQAVTPRGPDDEGRGGTA